MHLTRKKFALIACSVSIVSLFIFFIRVETGMLQIARPGGFSAGGSAECDGDLLCDENMQNCTPLMGYIDKNHDQLITRVLGLRIPYFHNDFYHGSRLCTAIFVVYSKSMSKISYRDYIEQETRKVFPLRQKTFSWEMRDGNPVLKVRMTKGFGDKNFTELWHDGNTGEYIQTVSWQP